jgi:hypothetical protein
VSKPRPLFLQVDMNWDIVLKWGYGSPRMSASHPCYIDPHFAREVFLLMKKIEGINPHVKPRATGCEGCLLTGGWWLHLRRCAECGYIACCDSSPGQHAEKHAFLTGHPIVASFEPLQNWFFDYRTGTIVRGMRLAPPRSRPESQPSPGPEGKVPQDWESLLHDFV